MEIQLTTLAAELENSARRGSAGMVFVYSNGSEEKVLYKAIYQKAISILGALQEKGVKQGDEVIIQLEDNRIFIEVFWACILGGFIPIPLSTGVQPEQKLKILKIWSSLVNPVVVCDNLQLNLSSAPEAAETEVLLINQKTIFKGELLDSELQGIPASLRETDIAYVQYSSGSTGDPKGVCLTHKNLLCNINDIILSLAMTPSDVLISWMPLTHDMGMIGFHLAGVVMSINTVSIPTSLFIRRPLIWMDKVALHKASVLYSPNFGIKYFLTAFEKREQPEWDLTAVRIIVNGAELISKSLCDDFTKCLNYYGLQAQTFVAAYGLAEASVEVSVTPPGFAIASYFLNRNFLKVGDTIQITKESDRRSVEFVDVGFPVNGCQLRITDNDNKPLPENTIGHVQIKGDNVTAGYYKNDAATAFIFTDDAWLKTGDLGFLRNGRLTVTGRFKNIILINGQNYYPQDIERVIISAGISEEGKIVACGISDQGEEHLIVFLHHKDDLMKFVAIADKTKQIIYKHIGVVAKHIIPIKKIPKTTSGKIQYFLLKSGYSEGKFDYILNILSNGKATNFQKHQIEWIVKVLTDAVIDVTGLRNIDKSLSFFEIGMNSLMAIQLVGHLKRRLQLALSVENVFVYDSIDRLSKYIYESETENLTNGQLEDVETAKVNYKEKKGHYPLSPGQKRLWLLSCMDRDSSAYNESLQYDIRGELDVTLFTKAVEALIKRHSIFRVNFVELNESPIQVINNYEAGRINFHYEDLSNHSDITRSHFYNIKELIAQHFDLAKDVLYRVYLSKIAGGEHHLLIIMPHIITDEFSGMLLIKELIENYKDLSSGLPLYSGASIFQYTDYAEWSHSDEQSRKAQRNLKYWLNEHRLNRQVLNLPLDFKRLPIKGSSGKRITFQVEDQICLGLQQYCKRENISLFMALLSGVYILISRYTAQEDITIGVPVADREDPRYQELIGFFVHILPLRINVPQRSTFGEVVQQVKERLLKGIDHASFPFDELVTELALPTDAGRSPLFDILVTSNTISKDRFVDDKKLLFKKNVSYNLGAKYDLSFYFEYDNDRTALILEYDTTLFNPNRIQRMAGHYMRLLSVLIGEQHTTISGVDYLSPGEKLKLLHVFNQPVVTIPGLNIIESFKQHVRNNPNAIAIKFKGRYFSYQEVDNYSTQLSLYLLERYSVQQNERIPLLMDRSEMMIISILAIWKAGATYLPLDPQFPEDRIAFVLLSTKPVVVLINEQFLKKCEPVFKAHKIANLVVEEFPLQNASIISDPLPLAELAYVMFTSGSSGEPKGVEVTHDAVMNIFRSLKDNLEITMTDSFLALSNYTFDISVVELFLPLVFGARVVLASKEEILDHYLFTELFEENQPTLMQATPSMWSTLIDSGWNGNENLCAISCGEMLSVSLKDKILERSGSLWNFYGPTETTIFSTGKKMKRDDLSVSIGTPLLNTKVYILDENQKLIPEGNFGEICIGGKGLAKGYFQQSSLTLNRFIANSHEVGTLIYRTGDLGRWLPNGNIELIGRLDEQIKLRGFRIELNEIEHVIASFANVRSVAVMIKEGKNSDQQLMAFVAWVKEADDNEHLLRSYLSSKLPSYMIPAFLITLNDLPVNTSGKVDKKLLKMMQLDETLTVDKSYRAPSTEIENKLVSIWKAILNKETIGINEDFFEIGGHSLKANLLINRIYKEWSIRVKFSDLFYFATIERQASLIESKANTRYTLIELL